MNTLQNSGSLSSLTDTGVYTDLTSLQKIKQLNNESEEGGKEALEAIAKQFESVFINMMMKSMRDANEAFKDDDMSGSNEMGFYQQMFDQQLALSISNRGFGLADALTRQLRQTIDPRSNPTDKPETVNPFNDYQAVPVQTDNSLSSSFENDREVFVDQQQFIDRMMPLAKQAAKKIGLDARYLVSQAALETGWGQHLIGNAQGRNSHNLFGIKAGNEWQGNVVVVDTLEYRHGVAAKEKASFRAYASYAESFEDYANFILQQERYSEAAGAVHSPEQYVRELQQAGYATDPEYANKIINIVSQNFSSVTDEGQG